MRFFLGIYNQQTSGLGLSLFRILYSLVLIVEVSQLIFLKELVFNNVPFVSTSETNPVFFLCAWILILICLAVGYKVRTVAICNYLLTLVTFSTFTTFEYHLDYAIIGLNFLMLFFPRNDPLSLDWHIARSSPLKTKAPKFSLSYNLMMVYLGVGLVYFDSVFHKFGSPMWLGGLGIWQPASIPFAIENDLTPILNQKWLMLFLGYLTLVFETVFLFLLPFRKIHPYLVLIGLGLHVGIVLAFPIPCFGLGVAALYLLLIPDTWYQRIPVVEKLLPKKETTSGVQQLPPIAKAGVGFIALTFLLQVICLVHSPVGGRFVQNSLKENAPSLQLFAHKTIALSTPILGIHPHGVFMDWHFANYNHIVSVSHRSRDGKETRLPLIDERGMPTGYNFGRFWVYYTFRVNTPDLNSRLLAMKLRDITAFWSYKNEIPLQDAVFEISVKKTASPNGWEKDFLRTQTKAPWQKAGELVWKNGQCSINLKDIETL